MLQAHLLTRLPGSPTGQAVCTWEEIRVSVPSRTTHTSKKLAWEGFKFGIVPDTVLFPLCRVASPVTMPVSYINLSPGTSNFPSARDNNLLCFS